MCKRLVTATSPPTKRDRCWANAVAAARHWTQLWLVLGSASASNARVCPTSTVWRGVPKGLALSSFFFCFVHFVFPIHSTIVFLPFFTFTCSFRLLIFTSFFCHFDSISLFTFSFGTTHLFAFLLWKANRSGIDCSFYALFCIPCLGHPNLTIYPSLYTYIQFNNINTRQIEFCKWQFHLRKLKNGTLNTEHWNWSLLAVSSAFHSLLLSFVTFYVLRFLRLSLHG